MRRLNSRPGRRTKVSPTSLALMLSASLALGCGAGGEAPETAAPAAGKAVVSGGLRVAAVFETPIGKWLAGTERSADLALEADLTTPRGEQEITADLTMAGVFQGYYWVPPQPWDVSVDGSYPFWVTRLVSAVAIASGFGCFLYNLFMTWQTARAARSAGGRAPSAEAFPDAS